MKNKISYIIMTSCFLIFIFGFVIAGLVSKDRDFSETENRILAQFPEFSWKRVKSGQYTSDLESYMSDQIFMKDQLVSLKVDADRLILKNYQNGIYFAKDGYIIQDYQENTELIKKNVDCLNSLADTVGEQAQMTFMLVPNAVSVMENKLPTANQSDNQLDSIDFVRNNLSSKINFYCPYEELKNAVTNGTQVFCRTDHHWTPEGAKIGFDGLMKSMNESIPDVNYDIETLKEFYGTLYSKAPSAFTRSDNINLYTNPLNKITVTYSGSSGDNSKLTEHSGIKLDSLFVDEFKTQKDKYKTFLGGNFDLLNIESQGESDEKVLIIKDSYANCTMPYFADKYKHITVMDMRYYHMEELSVSEYIKQNKIDKIIFLYNMDFVNTDNNFGWIE